MASNCCIRWDNNQQSVVQPSGEPIVDFDHLLDQAIEMLQRRGRLTYRTLKLQFQLDDDTLDVLKDELIYGQRLAIDEGDRVLVWAGPPTIPPAASAPPLVAQEAHPDQAPPMENVPTTAAVHVSHSPDAERRQLTVLFCDLVDSTSSRASSTPKTCARSCRPIKTPAPR